MEEKLAEALKDSGIKFTDNEGKRMDAADVAQVLINPEGEGLPLFPDPESAFNCPGASPSPPRHRRDAVPELIPTHRSCPPQLMIKNLNNKFGRNTEQAFKKKHTGLGWGRAVNLVDTAIELQHSLGRL